MLDFNKIVKVEICTSNGNVLQSLTKGYSFPKNYGKNSPEALMIVKGNNMPLYPKGSPVVVVVYLRSGDRICYASAVNVSTDAQLNIGIRIDRAVKLEERRRYFKIECEIPCRVIGFSRDERRYEFEPILGGRILNINLGGVFLHVNNEENSIDFRVEDILTVFVPQFGKENAGYYAKVLRVQTAPDGTLIGYGCKFLYLEPKREEFLGQYINNLQIEKRFKAKGKLS